MTITCRAAVAWEPKKPLVVEKVEVQPPKEGEVRIKVMFTAICDTDIYQLSGTDPRVKFPTIVGHEGAGVVESVGPGVQSVCAGDHVIPLPLCQCRECDVCADPTSNLCRKFLYFSENQQMLYDGTTRFSCRGQPIYHFIGCSTFSEYTVTPEIAVAKIDPSLPLDRMALLGCGVTTGYGSPIKGCPIRAGSTVGVWGMGAVGLAAVMGARDMGAKRIVAIDVNTDRLKAAKVFGATDLINPNELDESVPQFLTKKFDGGIDFAFEATGDAEAMAQAFESTKKCYGKTCILGLSSKEVPIPNGLLLQGRTLMGNTVGGFKTRDDVPMLAEKYKDGALQLDEFISWRCSLDQINEAWDKFQRGEGIRSMISVSNE
ncbi:hypothetical protein niasHT_021804 [Heterodera trifolii]|uniref:Enoyl reductase (ER) domain-containing protein n=1 Tax=Heterodera trifolii TaxID=157864 RepID=A0ABD2J8K4_9BILA